MNPLKNLFARLRSRSATVRASAVEELAAVNEHGRNVAAAAPAAEEPAAVESAPLPARAEPSVERTPFADFHSFHRQPLGAQRATSDFDRAMQAPSDTPHAAPYSSAKPWPDASVAPQPAARADLRTRAPGEVGTTVPSPVASPPFLSAGSWPHHQPDATAGALPRTAAPSARRLAIVLHAHLPWVLGHGTWPHGEDWLAEAVTHCYLPLLRALRRLAEEGGRDLLTLSISPVLAAQLADERTPPLVRGYLEHRRAAARELDGAHPLAVWWHAFYEDLAAEWDTIDGGLLPSFAALSRAGVIELSTCAVTHGYLPLLHRPEHVALQVRAAVWHHERWAGKAPAGLWMPECAYRPAGPWQHPVTGAREPLRAGNETFLAGAGVRWTVVDAHCIAGGEPMVPYPGFTLSEGWGAASGGTAVASPDATALQPVTIDASSVAALPREPHTAQQVWSRHGGYPGDARYLDFHKRQSETGLRLWRVTDAAGDLGDKLPYQPAEARAAVREHAEHFLAMVAAIPGLDDGVAVCPYDAELFGHWWLEGIDWLEEVLRRCGGAVTSTVPARELVQHPAGAATRLQEGSWGEAGDHRMWVNEATAWMWRDLRDAEEAVAAALPALAPEVARAVLAQLLLMAASDWPFLVTSGTAADYARDRFVAHRDRLQALLSSPADAPLPEWAALDLAGVELDPAWWQEPNA